MHNVVSFDLDQFCLELNVKREPRDHEGMFWIYGDSVSKAFAEYLVTGPYREICENVFKQCKVTYSWVYNTKNVESEENLDGKDYSHERVMREINKVNRYVILLTVMHDLHGAGCTKPVA